MPRLDVGPSKARLFLLSLSASLNTMLFSCTSAVTWEPPANATVPTTPSLCPTLWQHDRPTLAPPLSLWRWPPQSRRTFPPPRATPPPAAPHSPPPSDAAAPPHESRGDRSRGCPLWRRACQHHPPPAAAPPLANAVASGGAAAQIDIGRRRPPACCWSWRRQRR